MSGKLEVDTQRKANSLIAKPQLKSRRSLRRRRRIQLYVGAGFGLLLAVVAALALYVTTRPTTLTIAVVANNPEVRFLENISRILRERRTGARLNLIAVESGEASAAALSAGQVDLAVVRSDRILAEDRAVIVLRRDTVVILTSSKISKLAEVGRGSGTKIAVVGDSTADLIRRVLSIEGAAVNNVGFVAFPVSDVRSMVTDRSIEVFAIVGGVPEHEILETFEAVKRSRGHAALLEITSADAIVRRAPTLEAATIPKGLYGANQPPEEISSIEVSQLIVARKRLSDINAANFAREIFSQRQELLQGNSGSSTLLVPSTERDAAIQAHQGLTAYIEGTERTFLERYSDYFWGLVLVLSGVGSLGATFRAYFFKDEQQDLAASRREVLDLARAIREGASPRQMSEFDDRVDRLVRDTLKSYDDSIIDEGGLAAFGLALDHYQGARLAANSAE